MTILQERCRELETELAKLQLDLEELTAALARVEADAAASKEEKKRLRTEYEQRIQAVVEQMTGLQKQIKSQVGECVLQSNCFASSPAHAMYRMYKMLFR